MAEWIAGNWFELVQTAGVAGSLLFAGLALRADTKVRRTEVMLSLTKAHREIWQKLIDQPSLNRVRETEPDLDGEPPSQEERRFVQLVILHLATVRQAVAEGSFEPSAGMDADVRRFLALPIPRRVAESILPFQTEEFQAYLHSLME
jgi:hypothetical protein